MKAMITFKYKKLYLLQTIEGGYQGGPGDK